MLKYFIIFAFVLALLVHDFSFYLNGRRDFSLAIFYFTLSVIDILFLFFR